MKKFTFHIQDLKDHKEYSHEVLKDFHIFYVSTNKNPKSHSLIFSNEWAIEDESNFSQVENSLILVNKEASIEDKNIIENNQVFHVDCPRKHYAMILQYILQKEKETRKYHYYKENIIIGENVYIGENTTIEPFVFIDHDVVIGSNCIIESGVKIRKDVKIGNYTRIRENSVIGGPGFGVERKINKNPIRIPHLGGVNIGKHVIIGAMNSIASGTIEPTIIEDYIITDDLVFIAHNCKIKKGTLITACAQISGSTIVGENSWIGPNASIMQKIQLGQDCTVGLGSVVTKSFEKNQILVGNPADPIDQFKDIRKAQKKLIYEE